MKTLTLSIQSAQNLHLKIATIVTVTTVLLILFVCKQSNATTSYSLTDLGLLASSPTNWTFSEARDINNLGQVTGNSSATSNDGSWVSSGFIWDSNNGMIGIGGMDSYDHAYSYPLAINDSGDITGQLGGDGLDRSVFVWNSEDGMRNLNSFFDNGSDADSSVGYDINNSGQIVGYAQMVNGVRAFLWDSSTGVTDLGNGGANGINDKGQVVGRTRELGAFLWDQHNGFTQIDQGWSATAINNNGQVVGLLIGDTYHSYVWDETSGAVDIGELGLRDNEHVSVQDINNNGQVIGCISAPFSTDRDRIAFIWDKQNGIVNLNDLIDTTGNGWHFSWAFGINDSGQIVGIGYKDDGERRAVLLDPISPPPLPDGDSDGIPDDSDNCLDIYNPDQSDTDNDGRGDVCDTCLNDPENDTDEDDICGDVDNCPLTFNGDQLDLDGDGLGDVCDDDADGDGFYYYDYDCNDLNFQINPDACDIKRDGIDQNCDGQDRTTGRPCTKKIKEKICSDGIDNDGDGFIDCDDSDCLKKKNCRL